MPLDKGGDGCWYGAPVRLPDIRKWDHEDPALYEVTLTLRDAGGAVQETVPYKTGFRRFGMDQGVMKLNGERIVFNGGEPPRVESRGPGAPSAPRICTGPWRPSAATTSMRCAPATIPTRPSGIICAMKTAST